MRARRYRTVAELRRLLLPKVAAIYSACAVTFAACGESPDAKHLSSRGLYADISTRTTVSSAVEYEPDYPLWSDALQKRRWMILPAGKDIDTSDMAHWRFPVGTKLFKEFSTRGKLLETRLIERVANTGSVKRDFFMGTFVWSADQADAVLTADGVTGALGTQHDVPAQTACIQCHRGEPSAILGVSAVQLSRSGTIDEFADAGRLSVKPERRFPIPGNEIQSVAIGYMNANCGHCHSAEGIADVMRLRFLPSESDLPLEQSEIYKTTIHKKITDWKIHPDELQERVIPGDPEHSGLLYRMMQRGPDAPGVDDAMPPIASKLVHHEGVAAVEAWIATLPRDLPMADDTDVSPVPAKEPSQHDQDAEPAHDPSDMMAAAQAGRSAPAKPKAEGGSAAPSVDSNAETKMEHAAAGSAANLGDHPSAGAGSAGTAGLEASTSSPPVAGSPAAGSGGVGGAAEPAAGSGTAGAAAGAAGGGAAGVGAGAGAGTGAGGAAAGSGDAGSGGGSAGAGGHAGAEGGAGTGGSAAAGSGGDDDDDGHDEHQPH